MVADDDDVIQFRMVDQGEYQGVRYMVVERWMDFNGSDNTHTAFARHPFDGYFCGYVNIADTNRQPGPNEVVELNNIGGVELTYGPDSNWWVGFDTGHYGQEHYTDDQAIERTMSLIRALDPQ